MNLNVLLLYVCFSIPMWHVLTEPATDWARTKYDIFHGTKKVWHVYIRSFFHNCILRLQHFHLKDLGVQMLLSIYLSKLLSFRQYNSSELLTKQIKENTGKYLIKTNQSIQITESSIFFSAVLTNASGNIVLKSDIMVSSSILFQDYCRGGFVSNVLCYKGHFMVDSEFDFSFELFKHLSLNLTFLEVSFANGPANFFGSYTLCHFGYVCVMANAMQDKGRKLCGHMSLFSVHVMFHSLFMTVRIYPSTVPHISAEYACQDKHFMNTWVSERQFHKKMNLYYNVVKHNGLTKSKCYSLDIEVTKTKQIVMHSRSSAELLRVHDGPGFDCPLVKPIVKPSGKFYHLSSFRAVVIALHADCNDCELVSMQSKRVHFEEVHLENISYHRLPISPGCSLFLCSLTFKTHAKYQINLTILEVLFEGRASDSCKYGGFATAQFLGGLYMENQILCEHVFPNVRPTRKFYSSNSSLYVFLYSFPPYSKVTATIQAKITPCKFLHICPCKFRRHCPVLSKSDRTAALINYGLYCSVFVKHLQEAHNLNVFPNVVDGDITIYPDRDQCIVVHTARVTMCKLSWSTWYGFDISIKVGVPGAYSIEGILDQTFNGETFWQSCMYRCGHKNRIISPQDVTQNTPKRKHIFLRGSYKDMQLVFRYTEPRNAKNWIEMFLAFQQPTSEDHGTILSAVLSRSPSQVNSETVFFSRQTFSLRFSNPTLVHRQQQNKASYSKFELSMLLWPVKIGIFISNPICCTHPGKTFVIYNLVFAKADLWCFQQSIYLNWNQPWAQHLGLYLRSPGKDPSRIHFDLKHQISRETSYFDGLFKTTKSLFTKCNVLMWADRHRFIISALQVSSISLCHNGEGQLKVLLYHNNHNNSVQKGMCYNISTHFQNHEWNCLNVTSAHLYQNYIFYFVKPRGSEAETQTTFYLYIKNGSSSLVRNVQFSWMTSQSLCHNANGTLPSFISKQDFHEFRNLLLSNLSLKNAKVFFAGLYRNIQVHMFKHENMMCVLLCKCQLIWKHLFCAFQNQWKWDRHRTAAYLPFRNYQFNVSNSLCSCFNSSNTDDCQRYNTRKFAFHGTKKHQFCFNIENSLEKSSNILYPSVKGEDRCSLVLMWNLAEPDWINVNCYENMVPTLLCTQHKTQHISNTDANVIFISKKRSCKPRVFLIDGKCYLLLVTDISFHKIHADSTSFPESEQVMLQLSEIIEKPPPLVTKHLSEKNQAVILQCENKFGVTKCSQKNICNGTSALQVLRENFEVFASKLLVFQCDKGWSVALSGVCDGVVDCPLDKSDEKNCSYSVDTQTFNVSKTSSGFWHCGPLLFSTVKGKCSIFLLSAEESQARDMQPWNNCLKCDRNCTYNDLVVDWDFARNQSEIREEHDFLLLLQGYRSSCRNQWEIPCLNGHSKCFNLSQLCLFMLNHCKQLHPCRTGGHMENCKEFQCNNNFKCKHSYCVPWPYVCDAKWDCPDGQDESFSYVCSATGLICTDMFKCSKTPTCIPVNKVCDNILDCAYGDDEHFCQLKSLICPFQCKCLAFALQCVKDHHFLSHYPFVAIFLESSPKIYHIFVKFEMAYFLSAASCSLSEKLDVKFPVSLLYLNIRKNLFSFIPREYFSLSLKLKALILSDNKIKHLSAAPFSNLTDLLFLNLSGNTFDVFQKDLFFKTVELMYLSVLSITFTNINQEAFHLMKPQLVEASDYQICCLLPNNSFCTAKKVWYKSCGNLLQTTSVKVLFIATFVLLLVSNLSAFLIHLFTSQTSAAYNAIIVALSVSNMCLGKAFIVLSISDFTMSGAFHSNERWWRSGVTCFAVYGTVLFSSLTNLVWTLLLSSSRLMVVMFPFESKWKRVSFVIKMLFSSFIILCLFCIMKSLVMKLGYEHIPTEFCTPFFIYTNLKFPFIFIWFNFTLYVLSTGLMFGFHITTVTQTGKSKKNINSSRKENTGLAVQLVLLSVSLACCWIPVNIIYVTALVLKSYPVELIPWTMACVAPVNAIATPLILVGFIIKRHINVKINTTWKDGTVVSVAVCKVERKWKNNVL